MGGVETIGRAVLKTRQHFAAISFRCIVDAESGATRVNDLESYVAGEWEAIRASLAGENDSSFTFRQMVHFFETGECVPLLAPAER